MKDGVVDPQSGQFQKSVPKPVDMDPVAVAGIGPVNPEGKTAHVREILPEIEVRNDFIFILVR
jgi:hypothetical protein